MVNQQRSKSSKQVHSVSQLSPGVPIQASVNGTAHLQGTVEEIHPVLELFWVFGALGERRLIDFDTYAVTASS